MVTQEEVTLYEQMEAELTEARLSNQQLKNDLGRSSIFSSGENQNLIQWQLDLNEELERIDHLLRGHVIARDDNGNERWEDPKDDALKPFNAYGVQLLLNIISFYLNRNTILSNYKEEMINWKIKDLGDEITDLIYMKYKEMGMNTEGKRKLFPIIVREILDAIHSAYLRALHGGERESLRTARHVTQSDNQGLPFGRPVALAYSKRGSKLNPLNWGKG